LAVFMDGVRGAWKAGRPRSGSPCTGLRTYQRSASTLGPRRQCRWCEPTRPRRRARAGRVGPSWLV